MKEMQDKREGNFFVECEILMIRYDKLWDVMKEKGISQNRLYKEYGISRAQIHRLKHNQVRYTSTLDMLCRILKCGDLSDIATYLPDEEDKRDGGEP